MTLAHFSLLSSSSSSSSHDLFFSFYFVFASFLHFLSSSSSSSFSSHNIIFISIFITTILSISITLSIYRSIYLYLSSSPPPPSSSLRSTKHRVSHRWSRRTFPSTRSPNSGPPFAGDLTSYSTIDLITHPTTSKETDPDTRRSDTDTPSTIHPNDRLLERTQYKTNELSEIYIYTYYSVTDWSIITVSWLVHSPQPRVESRPEVKNRLTRSSPVELSWIDQIDPASGGNR